MPTDNVLKRDQQVEEADRLLDALPDNLKRWMAAEGLEPADELRRPHWQNDVRKPMMRAGTWNAADLWMQNQKKALQKVFKVSNYGRVCAEITRRFVRAKIEKSGAPKQATPIAGNEAELDALPDYLRWTVLHPGLCAEDDANPLTVADVAAYVKENPAPSRAALNLFNHCKGDKAARQKMFDEVKAVLLEERKKKKAPVGEQDQKEVQRIADMKAELEKMRGKSA